MIDKIKKLILQIDGIYRLTISLRPLYIAGRRVEATSSTDRSFENSQEIIDAARSLMLAKQSMREHLQGYSYETYAVDINLKNKDETEEDFLKRAKENNLGVLLKEDYSKFTEADSYICYTKELLVDIDYSEGNHQYKVEWLRKEIKKISNNEVYTTTVFSKDYDAFSTWAINSYKYLHEAIWFLGLELERISTEKQ